MSSVEADHTMDATVEEPEEREHGFSLRRNVGEAIAAHGPFIAVSIVGVAMRIVALLGFRPALWYNDGFEYVGVALRLQPYPIRPSGYSLFLRAVEPFHSFTLVVALQHVMGVACGLIVYGLCRRLGAGRWLAAAGALPVMLDAYEIQLEHMILSDTLFLLLVVAAFAFLIAPRPRPSTARAAVGGVLLAAAILARTVGVPLVLVALAWLLVKRAGWRSVGAFALALLVPLVAYASWFNGTHGRFALTSSEGIFLYSRTLRFADCRKMAPPPDERVLCLRVPVSERAPSEAYIWQPISPLNRIPGDTFSLEKNDLARRFALRAIRSQPRAYASVVVRDFGRTFWFQRDDFPSPSSNDPFRFRNPPVPLEDRVFVTGGSAREDTMAYERGDPSARKITPWSTIMNGYQAAVFLPGIGLGLVLASGLVLIVILMWRRRGGWGEPAILWTVAFALLITPPATAEFHYRYVQPAIPIAAAALAIAIAALRTERRPPPDQPGEVSG